MISIEFSRLHALSRTTFIKHGVYLGDEMKPFQSYKGDLTGGLSAAIITLPMSIAYGVTAFAALGTDFMPHAALIGLNAAVFGGFFAALFGGAPVQITGPKAPLTLIITTVVAGLALDPMIHGAGENTPWIIVGVVSACVLIGGATQVLSGVLGLGNIVKYVPYPVVAGFMNGIAILLIWNQIPHFFGLPSGILPWEILPDLAPVNWTSATIGSATLISIVLSRRLRLNLPAFLVGLVVGSAIYLLLTLIPGASRHVDSIGNLRAVIPAPTALAGLAQLPWGSIHAAWLLKIVVYGMVLGIIGSMESLMSAMTIDNIQASRHDSKRELVGQGLGNIIASLFGALSAAGSIPRSVANYKAGGRSRLSGALCSGYILIIFLTLAPVLGKIPLAVFAAIIISVGINLFDSSTWVLLKGLRYAGKFRKDITISLLVNTSVAIITICVNLITAVIIGLAISAAYFIVKIGGSIIRREFTGARLSSNKVRSSRHLEVLKEANQAIKVFQLQGPLFFGSADRLARHLEAAMVDAAYCILDMRHVNEIDTTGAKILLRIFRRLRKDEKWLLISHIPAHGALWNSLDCNGVTREMPPTCFFQDTDNALEWAEDRLLDKLCTEAACSQSELADFDIVKGFAEDELNLFNGLLTRENYKKGDLIIFEGNSDRDLLLLASGTASAKIELPQSNREKRLFTFDAGAIFGEMALLDGKPRSAHVQAEDDAVVFRLPYEKYKAILAGQPIMAAKLYKNIALVLSHRLRVRSEELRILEDD